MVRRSTRAAQDDEPSGPPLEHGDDKRFEDGGCCLHVIVLRYVEVVERRKVWTAEELFKLTPAEQDELFKASIVRDLDQAPPALVARARARLEERIARTESTPR
jgi:hypothetical protein